MSVGPESHCCIWIDTDDEPIILVDIGFQINSVHFVDKSTRQKLKLKSIVWIKLFCSRNSKPDGPRQLFLWRGRGGSGNKRKTHSPMVTVRYKYKCFELSDNDQNMGHSKFIRVYLDILNIFLCPWWSQNPNNLQQSIFGLFHWNFYIKLLVLHWCFFFVCLKRNRRLTIF